MAWVPPPAPTDGLLLDKLHYQWVPILGLPWALRSASCPQVGPVHRGLSLPPPTGLHPSPGHRTCGPFQFTSDAKLPAK